MLKLALFGKPVGHSLSPRIHTNFANQFGLPLEYELIESGPGGFETRLRQLIAKGADGCNITVPLKQLALELADRVSPAAHRAGAANTLQFTADGIFADNTDGEGWLTDLRHAGIGIHDRRICILGAGGAIRGLLPVILAREPRRLVLANRGVDKARDLLTDFPATGDIEVLPLSRLASIRGFDLVINGTSMGHQQAMPPLCPELFAAGALLYDLNYGPAATPLRDWSRSQAVRFRDGLGMLVEQAALSFQLWTGHSPQTSTLIENLRSASSCR